MFFPQVSSATSVVRRLEGWLGPGEPVGRGSRVGVCTPVSLVLLPCRHPSRPDCAALPLPARHGRGAGAPGISGSPPSPKATSAHLPPATHHRPCPLQVQVAGAALGRGGEGSGPHAAQGRPTRGTTFCACCCALGSRKERSSRGISQGRGTRREGARTSVLGAFLIPVFLSPSVTRI